MGGYFVDRCSVSTGQNALISMVLSLCIGFSATLFAQNSPLNSASSNPDLAGFEQEPPTLVRDEALYSVEIPVTSREQRERRGAVARALVQAVVRLSGQTSAATNPVIQRAMRTADQLALDTNYRQSEERAGGVPVVRQSLQVTFEPSGVDALLAAAGLPYWNSPRPKPMLWFAIDDGRGARLVGSQQLNVVRPLAKRGLERGLRFLLPAGNATELQAVNAVVSKNATALAQVNARYNNPVMLIGSMARSAAGWTASWLLVDGQTTLNQWSFSDADAQPVIASGADGAADAIAKRDSLEVDAGDPGIYTVEIIGIRSAADYLRLMGYLQTLAVVRDLEVTHSGSEQLTVKLDLTVGLKGFDALLATGQVLESLTEPDPIDVAAAAAAPMPQPALPVAEPDASTAFSPPAATRQYLLRR